MSRLGSSVDQSCRARWVLGPGWNQPPKHLREVACGLGRVLANDRHGLGRSDIVSRRPILDIRSRVKVFFDDLLSSRKSVTPAHAMQLWQIAQRAAGCASVRVMSQDPKKPRARHPRWRKAKNGAPTGPLQVFGPRAA